MLIVQIYLVTLRRLTDLVIKEHYIMAGMQMYVNDSCFKWLGRDILQIHKMAATK